MEASWSEPEEAMMFHGDLPQSLGHLETSQLVGGRLMRLLKLSSTQQIQHSLDEISLNDCKKSDVVGCHWETQSVHWCRSVVTYGGSESVRSSRQTVSDYILRQ